MTTTALTPKQRVVLEALEQGDSIPAIAKRLKVQTSGVYGHIRRIRAAGVTLPSERVEAKADAPESTNGNPPLDTDIPERIRAQMESEAISTRELIAQRADLEAKAHELDAMIAVKQTLIERHRTALSAYAA